MANDTNEMFTTRSGRRVPIKCFTIPADVMVSVMRLQEDHEARGERLSITGIVLAMLDKGEYSIRAHWKAAEKTKAQKGFAKGAAALFGRDGKITDPAAMQALAIKFGLIKGLRVKSDEEESNIESDIESDGAPEPTDAELEALTAPVE